MLDSYLADRRKQKQAELEAERNATSEYKKAKEDSKNKVNLGDVILAYLGLPALSSNAEKLKKGDKSAGLSSLSAIPVVGEVTDSIAGVRGYVPDVLDTAVKLTDTESDPAARLNEIFASLNTLSPPAKSAANPIPGIDLNKSSTGGSETLNDVFRLLRSIK